MHSRGVSMQKCVSLCGLVKTSSHIRCTDSPWTMETGLKSAICSNGFKMSMLASSEANSINLPSLLAGQFISSPHKRRQKNSCSDYNAEENKMKKTKNKKIITSEKRKKKC